MKKVFTLFLIFICGHALFAQVSSADYAVPLTATTNLLTPSITINWPYADSATAYHVYRKLKDTQSWGTALATLTTTDTSYTDTHVAIDTGYEYRVEKTAYQTVEDGYIFSAISLPADHDKGILLMVVDSFFADSLPVEVHRLMKDISGDGWEVKQILIGRNQLVPDVKAAILTEVLQDSTRTHAALLLGHIPVPYSGDINPDGHPNHLGAWPADVYYADLNGNWTDTYINDTTAGYAANRNIPGDGKFDNSYIASSLELEISRVDFYNMPSVPRSETQLMKNYLDKDHAYRQKLFVPLHRGLVDDNFGVFGGEAFASCGIRNFSPLLGSGNTFNLDFISTLNTSSYQWGYGCGGGSFNSAGGIGSTNNFANDSVQAVFTMLFGSYFGDWNVQDNFLRAPLCASDPALTCCWAGRPYWFFHHMALGENIGYSARLTQNNPYLYNANYGVQFVHVALMGDLTLKEDAVSPAASLVIQPGNSGATLTWAASTDSIVGYYVYKSTTEFGHYQLASGLVSSTSFYDSAGTNGLQYYMVRACKYQPGPSGNYFNLSEGVGDSATVNYITTSIAKPETTISLLLYPNPTSDKIFITGDAIRIGDELEIINALGEKVFATKISSDKDLQLDVSALNSGSYFLHLTGSRKSMVKSFVIMR